MSCFVFPRLGLCSCRQGPATLLRQCEALPVPDQVQLLIGSFQKAEPQERVCAVV